MNAIVVDANIALALIMPLPYSESAAGCMLLWKETGVELLAPALWAYEVVSGLRKAVSAGVYSTEAALVGLEQLSRLGIEQVPPSLELQQSALAWAQRLGQRVAYDAAYLAVAEERRADVWTADRSLVRAAQAAGARWVHWVGEVGAVAQE